jgi:putative hemolysin
MFHLVNLGARFVHTAIPCPRFETLAHYVRRPAAPIQYPCFSNLVQMLSDTPKRRRGLEQSADSLCTAAGGNVETPENPRLGCSLCALFGGTLGRYSTVAGCSPYEILRHGQWWSYTVQDTHVLSTPLILDKWSRIFQTT